MPHMNDCMPHMNDTYATRCNSRCIKLLYRLISFSNFLSFIMNGLMILFCFMVLYTVSARVCTRDELHSHLLQDDQLLLQGEECLFALYQNGIDAFCGSKCNFIFEEAKLIPDCHTKNGLPLLSEEHRNICSSWKAQCKATGTITIPTHHATRMLLSLQH